MDAANVKQIVDACNEKELNYSIITMMPTFIRKNTNNFIKVQGDNIYGFRKPLFSENNGVSGIEMLICPAEQVCEIHITADYKDMKELASDLGLTLTEEELNHLIHMDKYDAPLEPATGDYNRFKYITGKNYELLTEEEKAEYETAKAAYEKEKANHLGVNQAASISMF